MLRDDIAALVRTAATAAMQAGALPSVPLPDDLSPDRPRQPEHGDYASNIAMRLQRAVGGNPLAIAETIVNHLPASPLIGAAMVARPGFINFRISEDWLRGRVDSIRAQGASYADSRAGAGQKVQVEFVSANPTGPLTVGNGRGAMIGDTLARAFLATGYEVCREYYVNDAGTQSEVFGRTLYARYCQLFGRTVEIPKDGYPGEYMVDVAMEIKQAHGEAFLRPEGEDGPKELGALGLELMVNQIRTDLAALGVHYDVWFSERDVYQPGADGRSEYESIMELLRARGYLAEREGATWFTSSDIGEDKDNVLVRSTGAPGYFASDIAYHHNKFFTRGFDRVIDVWGADHHGHVSRMKAAVSALGGDPAKLDVLLYQLVTVREDGQIVRLSKRRGRLLELRDLVEDVGTDVCRFFFLQRSADSTLDFDITLAKTESDKNPVHYVQYAHARCCSILRTAEERGLQPDGDVALLGQPTELALVRKMLQLPELLDLIVRSLEPHHLTFFALELATAFNSLYHEVAVMSRQGRYAADVPPELSRSRLKLIDAARVALARVLDLMGMTAPDRKSRDDDE